MLLVRHRDVGSDWSVGVCGVWMASCVCVVRVGRMDWTVGNKSSVGRIYE